MIRNFHEWEKLNTAVRILTASAPLRDRLVYALTEISLIDADGLPQEIREDFKQFWNGITAVEAKGSEGRIQATVDTLDDLGVDRAVEKIVRYYDTVCRHMGPR